MLVQQSDEVASTDIARPRQSVQEQVEAIFQKMTALVDIHYQKLDRLTDHGILDLPRGTTLDAILSPSP